MKKTVGVLSLIVMLLSQVFSPFAYAVSGEEVPIPEPVVEEVVPEPEVGESEVAPEIDNSTGDNNFEVVEPSTGEVANLVVPVDVEVNTGTVISTGEETKNLEEEGTEASSGFIEKITETIKDFLGITGEENENFGSKEIYGTGEYGGVKVEVYAQTGLFASGTELTIEPVVEGKLQAVQEVLLSGEVNLVEEQVIAFDITFRDPETQEELQPKGGTVQVKFNYEENANLVQAEEDEEQEVKVYHLNDVDEEGNKIEELTGTKLEEVIINEEKSEEENVMVVEANSFSIYTIVQQVKEEGPEALEDQLANFVYGEISIARPVGYEGDGPAGFTIMDRNLGATATGAGIDLTKKSYGYHYQWGNNYGFNSVIYELNNDYRTGTKVNLPEGVTEYYSKKFVYGSSNYTWMQTNRDTLWQGQGPCPNGWHIPTIDEWNQLLEYYAGYYTGNSLGAVSLEGILHNVSSLDFASGFYNYFKIPFVATRNWMSGFISNQSQIANLWSSSPYSNEARNLFLDVSRVSTQSSYGRSNGFSVRCFKDTYSGTGEIHTITFNFNGGSGSTAAINVLSGEKAEKPTDPVKEGYEFLGWYEKNGDEYAAEPFDFTGTEIIEDIELYAKWGSYAILLPGEDFNRAVKQLANGTYLSYTTDDLNITAFLKANTLGDNYVTISSSGIPVYAWYDGGIIYYYTEANKVYLNQNSSSMFRRLTNLEEVDLDGFDSSKVMFMSYMFEKTSIQTIDLSSFDTSNLVSMQYIFSDCKELVSVNLDNFNLSKFGDAGNSSNRMFYGCDKLDNISLRNLKLASSENDLMYLWGLDTLNVKTIDVTNWDFELVGDMGRSFWGMNSLETIIGMDSWKNMSHIANMSKMFFGCSGLTSLDLSAFDTSNVTNMSSMFEGCNKVKVLDLSAFDMRNVIHAGYMFGDMVNLETIYVGDSFELTGNSGLSHQYMFSGVISLVGGNGTKYSEDKIDKTYAKIDNENQIGYFTDPSHFAIRFKTQDGEEITTQWIAIGETAQALTGKHMNYNYYTGADLEHEFDLNIPLYAYTELYASGTDAYEVKFYSGDTLVDTFYVTGDNQSKLSMPEDLEGGEGYDFIGWYEKNGDEYVAEPFDFTGTVITGDIELYAKWGNPTVGGYSWHYSCFEFESLGVDDIGNYSVKLIGYDSESCGLENLVIPGIVSKNGKDYYVKKIGESLFLHAGLSGTLVIGNGVEEIENHSFGYNNIEKVIFPDSLKTVGRYAFDGNIGLETIDFGQGVESLGYSSFSNCGLKSLSFPSSLKIIGMYLDDQNGVFQNNTGLQTVQFSEGIEVIGGYAFANTKIESLSFPNSLTGIGIFAFANNPVLNEVIPNEGLQYIGSYAFSNEPSLTSFVIPSTVGYLGSNIFGNHNTVTPITYLEINAKNAQLGYGIFEYLPVKKLMYNGSGSIPGNTFNTLNSLNELIIGDDVTSIGSDAFHNSPITGLIIPGNVKSIGNYAFYNSSLKKLEIENGVLSIGDSVFGIDEIESVFIPDSVTSLGGSVFRGGGIIHRLVVGDGVVSMGNCPFGNVEILELGDGITSLGPWNFCSPSNGVLRKIKIGNGVTSITNGTFTNSKNLEEIEIGNGLVQIQQGVFGGTPNLMNLKLGNSLTTIGAGEFSGAQFSGIQLPLSLTTLGNGVFCSDSVKEPGSIVGVVSGATAAQIESLEAQDNTACFVIKKDKYTLTYNAGVHSGLVDNQLSIGLVVDYNGIVQLTGNGAKTAVSQKGYTFLGWTTELNGTTPLDASTYTITGDVTFYPVFKKDSVTKKIKFYKNGNEGYTYDGNNYAEDQEFYLCTIQERYNADENITTCSEEIEFPVGISENTPVTRGWTKNPEGEGDIYTGGEEKEIISEDSTIAFYLQMYTPEKVYKTSYEYGTGVEEGVVTSGSCVIAETINGNIQAESCGVNLPELNVLTGYHAPLWYRKGEDITYPNLTITLTGDVILEAKATANNYTVVYQPGAGTGEMESQEFEYDKEESLNKNKYTKEGYHFSGWIDSIGKEYRDGESVLNIITEGIIEFTAQWLQNEPAAGGGKVVNQIKQESEEQEHNVAEENESIEKEETKEETTTTNQTNTNSTASIETVQVDKEVQSAYEWAYGESVTTMPTLDEAMPEGVVKRGHLAKMVVNYATNVLGYTIPEKIPSYCRWNDWRSDWESEEIKEYAVKSCALGLMGLDMDKFLPNMEVTRAQFGTIMSRLLWGKKYAGGIPYYRKHLNALKENGIMTQIENPEKRIELRQWVWLMLMRSTENK